MFPSFSDIELFDEKKQDSHVHNDYKTATILYVYLVVSKAIDLTSDIKN